MADVGWRPPATLCQQPVGTVVGELVREEPQGQVIELGVIAPRLNAAADEFEQLGCQRTSPCSLSLWERLYPGVRVRYRRGR